jgi:hypothetical protein
MAVFAGEFARAAAAILSPAASEAIFAGATLTIGGALITACYAGLVKFGVIESLFGHDRRASKRPGAPRKIPVPKKLEF